MRIDSFSYAGEQDMLECRLTELDSVIDRWVIVEADVTHGGNQAKPYHYLDQRDRFAPWADRIVYVQATDLPDLPDAWSRELAQREWVWSGLRVLDAQPDDIILHGDIDEIPTAFAAKLVRPHGMVVMHQRFHPFAVDWFHPAVWEGTVAAKLSSIGRFAMMRQSRMTAPHDTKHRIPDAGWHLSWVSDSIESKEAKIDSFCHPEIAPTWRGRLADCYETGLHVDGVPLQPVDVDESWPRWIVEGHAPAAWFRPRDVTRPRPVVHVPQLVAPNAGRVL